MKALSVHPYFAYGIFSLLKTVECRSWKTNYRGDILICSTAKKCKGTIPGHALCVVTLKDVVPMEKKHIEPALMFEEQFREGQYAWLLDNVRVIKPFPVKGKLSLWECDHEIEYLDTSKGDEENERILQEYFDPITYNGEKMEW